MLRTLSLVLSSCMGAAPSVGDRRSPNRTNTIERPGEVETRTLNQDLTLNVNAITVGEIERRHLTDRKVQIRADLTRERGMSAASEDLLGAVHRTILQLWRRECR